MWVAYLIPTEDHHLVVEDGIGFIQSGETAEEAIEKLEVEYRTAWTFESECDWNEINEVFEGWFNRGMAPTTSHVLHIKEMK